MVSEGTRVVTEDRRGYREKYQDPTDRKSMSNILYNRIPENLFSLVLP